MKKFTDKIIWITGASSGIGESLAMQLSQQKNTIILSSRNTDKLEELAKKCNKLGGSAFVAPIDLSNSDSINKTADLVLEKYNKIDLLINNGGISQRSYVDETPVEVDRKIMEINFFGQVTLTKRVLKNMIASKSGHIAVTSSIVGKFGFPLRSAYSASKHALQGFFETLKIEQKINNINVSIIIPGRIQTNISVNALLKDGESHGIMDAGQQGGMDVNFCAKKIIKGLEKQKYEIMVGGKELIMVFLRKFFKGIFFKLAAKVKST